MRHAESLSLGGRAAANGLFFFMRSRVRETTSAGGNSPVTYPILVLSGKRKVIRDVAGLVNGGRLTSVLRAQILAAHGSPL